jgi:hypothetical protein
MNGKILLLQGAYGRTYATIEAARKDWEAGKDFKIVGGPYCSIRDMKQMLQFYGHAISIVLDISGYRVEVARSDVPRECLAGII